MIEVHGYTKMYGEMKAVDKLSFSVKAGDVLGLVGPNGAGKTSTLRALAGILHPTEGQIRINNIDLVANPVLAKKHLAFIPDEPHLFEYLTVGEHLMFMARLYQVNDANPKIENLLLELELQDKKDAMPGELSRGMKQKLAIACGLLHEPSVLILDEPLTGLDPVGIRRMKATISKRAQSGTAVILSSHLLHLVEELCSQLLVIRNGKRVAYGTVQEIVTEKPELQGLSLEEIFMTLTSEKADSPETQTL